MSKRKPHPTAVFLIIRAPFGPSIWTGDLSEHSRIAPIFAHVEETYPTAKWGLVDHVNEDAVLGFWIGPTPTDRSALLESVMAKVRRHLGGEAVKGIWEEII